MKCLVYADSQPQKHSKLRIVHLRWNTKNIHTYICCSHLTFLFRACFLSRCTILPIWTVFMLNGVFLASSCRLSNFSSVFAVHCGCKSISFANPIDVCVPYNMLAHSHIEHERLYSRCGNLDTGFFNARAWLVGWLHAVCMVKGEWMCSDGHSAICFTHSQCRHRRFILNVICPL